MILRFGGNFAQVTKAGQWDSSARKLNLELGEGEAGAMARARIEISNDGGPRARGPRRT